MKQKINLLIGFSSVVLVILITIQCYLVKTAYDYKVAQFQMEIKDRIASITNDFSDIDSSMVNYKGYHYNHILKSYLNEKKSKFKLRSRLIAGSRNPFLTQLLQKKFDRVFPNNTIDFAIITNKCIVLNPTQKVDTIFSEKPQIKNLVCGNLSSLKQAFSIRNYVHSNAEIANHKMLTEEILFVSIKNWKQIIFQRMLTILLVTVSLILILILLFIITIKALLKQKKLSDVKTDFINNITHELKTPLTTLSISSKMLERKEIQNNEQSFKSILQTVDRQNNRVQKIIDQVLSNSLGFDAIALCKEEVNINAFMATILNDFKLTYPETTIELKNESAEMYLKIDKFHLTTAINNVLDNAVKYGCKKILLNTTTQNDTYKISITDDGIGIAKNKQALLFEKFYRVEQGNLHNTKGLGLGLYYVEQIIKAHQGTIKILSDMGKGSTFTLSIPTVK